MDLFGEWDHPSLEKWKSLSNIDTTQEQNCFCCEDRLVGDGKKGREGGAGRCMVFFFFF